MIHIPRRAWWLVLALAVVTAATLLLAQSTPVDAGPSTGSILTCPDKRGIVWEPAHADEVAGIGPGYIERDGGGGFRMIYRGARFVPGEGTEFTIKYAESDDGLHWPASRREVVEIVPAPESERGFDLRRPAPKKGGGYYTISYDRMDASGNRGAALWEAPELRGPWTRTGALFPTTGSFNEPQGALGWVPEIRRHVSFIRPAERFDSNYWRSLKRALGSPDLSEWEPDFTAPVVPELTTEGEGVDQYYAIAPALIDGVLWGLVMRYRLDPDFEDMGNRDAEGEENTVDVVLFSSVDYGESWSAEYGGKPFLARGRQGSWDGGQVHAFNPVVVDGEVWIFYTGGRQRHIAQHADIGTTFRNDQPYRMGLAVSRLVPREDRETERQDVGCSSPGARAASSPR